MRINLAGAYPPLVPKSVPWGMRRGWTGVSSVCCWQLTLLLSAWLHNSTVTEATKVLSVIKSERKTLCVLPQMASEKNSWLHTEQTVFPHPFSTDVLEKMKGRELWRWTLIDCTLPEVSDYSCINSNSTTSAAGCLPLKLRSIQENSISSPWKAQREIQKVCWQTISGHLFIL